MSIELDPKTEQQVTAEIEKQTQDFHYRIIRQLNIAGVQGVNVARSVATKSGYAGSGRPYKVQTGNLTSSVGYIVTDNGKNVNESSFDAVEGENGSVGYEGSEKGRLYARQLVSEYPTGYNLIMVAGMDYASYVQELRGRDVLASATLVATELVNELKTKLAK